MAQATPVPDGWQCTRDEARYHSFMDREYTTIAYEDAESNRKILISDVQEPNSFGGWGYLVRVLGPDGGQLGLVEDVETARELALDYMRRE